MKKVTSYDLFAEIRHIITDQFDFYCLQIDLDGFPIRIKLDREVQAMLAMYCRSADGKEVIDNE